MEGLSRTTNANFDPLATLCQNVLVALAQNPTDLYTTTSEDSSPVLEAVNGVVSMISQKKTADPKEQSEPSVPDTAKA
jgi:hypothetical protein